ncbi:hypothetical protein [Bailinhaonella thermotolerans]|uniref:hypothetical protein n=1 Tax=Bailinhaonella thermotolerans TaxID=1070861 RepID=UPI00192A4514|nr:hypothetical protein [Bailinhaonella thermotolerans]
MVWLIWPVDPLSVTARSAAQRLNQRGIPAHLVWNPLNGEIVQTLPATRAACGLTAADRGERINREGRVCLQIRVLGSVREPFTDGPMAGLDAILTWLDSWRVPRRWPAGPPLPHPHSLGCDRSRRLWARGGHFGHSQVPGTDQADPGAIDIRRITGPQTPVVEVPRPREEVREPMLLPTPV